MGLIIVDHFFELMWPRLEPLGANGAYKPKKIDEIQNEIEQVPNGCLDDVLDQAEKTYAREEERRSTVEGKASALVAFNSFIMALVTLSATWLLKVENGLGKYGLLVAIVVFMTALYFTKGVLYAIKALGRAEYHTVTGGKIYQLQAEKKEDWLIKLSSLYYWSAQANYNTVNEKVDNMVMAQEYVKRGLLGLLTLVGVLLIKYVIEFFGAWGQAVICGVSELISRFC